MKRKKKRMRLWRAQGRSDKIEEFCIVCADSRKEVLNLANKIGSDVVYKAGYVTICDWMYSPCDFPKVFLRFRVEKTEDGQKQSLKFK